MGGFGFWPSSKIFYNLGSEVVTFTLLSDMIRATKQFGRVCHTSSPGCIVSRMAGELLWSTSVHNLQALHINMTVLCGSLSKKCFQEITFEFHFHTRIFLLWMYICLLHLRGAKVKGVAASYKTTFFPLSLWRLSPLSRASFFLAAWFMGVPRWPYSVVSCRALSQ